MATGKGCGGGVSSQLGVVVVGAGAGSIADVFVVLLVLRLEGGPAASAEMPQRPTRGDAEGGPTEHVRG